MCASWQVVHAGELVGLVGEARQLCVPLGVGQPRRQPRALPRDGREEPLVHGIAAGLVFGVELAPGGLRGRDRILDVVAGVVLELLADVGATRVLGGARLGLGLGRGGIGTQLFESGPGRGRGGIEPGLEQRWRLVEGGQLLPGLDGGIERRLDGVDARLVRESFHHVAQPVATELAGWRRGLDGCRLLIAQPRARPSRHQLVLRAIGDLLERVRVGERLERRQRDVLVFAVEGDQQALGRIGHQGEGGQADAAAGGPARDAADQARRRHAAQRRKAHGLRIGRTRDHGQVALVVETRQRLERFGLIAAVGGDVHQELARLGTDAFVHVAAGRRRQACRCLPRAPRPGDERRDPRPRGRDCTAPPARRLRAR